MDVKKNGAFALVFLLSICAFAQQKQGSNWLFGNGARIGFNSGTAVSDTGSLVRESY